MLPVYVLPEHFPSKARQTICNNPNRHSPMGQTEKERRTYEILPMILKSAKVFDFIF